MALAVTFFCAKFYYFNVISTIKRNVSGSFFFLFSFFFVSDQIASFQLKQVVAFLCLFSINLKLLSDLSAIESTV